MTDSSPELPLAAIVLAAGKGTRMKSDLPKALHPLCGAPLTAHVLTALRSAGVQTSVVVIGHEAEKVRAALGDDCAYAYQREQLGTGHAAMQAAPFLQDFHGLVVIAPGDAPLVTPAALSALVGTHVATGAACTLLTCEAPDPRGYGRIVRDDGGRVTGIVEDRDATAEQRAIREICTSFYCFTPQSLFGALPSLSNDNAQREYYLTDVVAAMASAGLRVETSVVADPCEVMGVNSRWELAQAAEVMRLLIARHHALAGVSIVDPRTTYIDVGVTIGLDTVVHPMTVLAGTTVIGAACSVGPFTRIEDSLVGDDAVVLSSNLDRARLGNGVRIGPYANIRPKSVIGDGARIGNFVETKNADIGERVSASHLTYIGDATVGEGSNIGAGTITCNYDGCIKNRTAIGKNVFVGSDSTLVAPVEIGDGAYIAASSVITEDVPPDSLAIARSRQTNKEGWAKRWRERK